MATPADRLFHVHGRLVDELGAPRGCLFVAIADRDLLLDDLLGTGWADEDGLFRLSFPRESFHLDWFESERAPDLYVVVSEGEHRRALTPLMRHNAPAVAGSGGEIDLGDLVVPAARAATAPADAIPGPRRYRPALLHLDAQLVEAAFEEMTPRIESLTGWTGLLDGIQVAFDDEVDGHERRAIVLKGSGLPPEAASWLEARIVGSSDALAMFDPFGRRVILKRRLLARDTYEQLKQTIGHELVHVGQYGNHPELLEENSRLLRRAYDFEKAYSGGGGEGAREAFRDWAAVRWRGATASYLEFAREAEALGRELVDAWFGYRANLESYAAYIERFHVVKPGDCAHAQFDESLFAFLAGSLRGAAPVSELIFVAPDRDRDRGEDSRDIYSALVPAYLDAQGTSTRPAAFDPRRRPAPSPESSPEEAGGEPSRGDDAGA